MRTQTCMHAYTHRVEGAASTHAAKLAAIDGAGDDAEQENYLGIHSNITYLSTFPVFCSLEPSWQGLSDSMCTFAGQVKPQTGLFDLANLSADEVVLLKIDFGTIRK